MRVIKFRGKRIDNGAWVEGDLLTSLSMDGITRHPAIRITECSKCIFFVIPETVGQFTGLYDINGKEIYEGDIVRKTTKSGYPDNLIGEIVFRNGLFGIKNDSRYGLLVSIIVTESEWVDGNASGTLIYEYAVIGSVYDNEELLEEHGKDF